MKPPTHARRPFPPEQEPSIAATRKALLDAHGVYWELRGCTLYPWPLANLELAHSKLRAHMAATCPVREHCHGKIVRVTRKAKPADAIPTGSREDRKKLQESFDRCRQAALACLYDAAGCMHAGLPEDDVTEHVSAAILYLGEARGHRNALYDLDQEGGAK